MQMNWKTAWPVGGVVVWWAVTTVAWAAEVRSLRREYRNDPLGVDTSAPRLSWLIASDDTHPAFARLPGGPIYSGKTTWDPVTATLTFASSGSMPEAKEDFHWQVPAEVKRIVIGANVIVRGGFRVPFRAAGNPLHIVGSDRETSIILGTDEEQWTTRNGVADNEKWKYGTVSVVADATVHISNLTSRNPRGYHLSGYANKSVLHVSRCNLLDTRPGQNNNSDGFVGSAGSTISDSFISTGDDAIKIYHDITIRNVVIEHHRNGAPIQFGWGGESGHAKATIENLTIKGVSPDKLYNMAPFTWEGGSSGTRDVTIRGLHLETTGKLYDEETKSWMPIGLFELKPKSCTLNLTITNANIGAADNGIRHTRGVISLNGTIAP